MKAKTKPAPRQSDIARERVRAFCRQAHNEPYSSAVLEHAFEELASFVELLETVETQAVAALERALTEHEAECQALEHYQNLFTEAPLAYLITGLDGTIRQANDAATVLLGLEERSLVGRSMAMFIPNGQRRPFRAKLADLRDENAPRILDYQLENASGTALGASLYVGVARAPSGRPQALRWVLLPNGVNRYSTSQRDGATPVHNGHDTNGAGSDFAQLFAVLGQANELLHSSDDAPQMLGHLAQSLVPSLADGCVVDVDLSDGKHVRLVASAADTDTSDHSNNGYHDDTHMSQLQWLNDDTAMDTHFALEGLPRREALRTLIHALTPTSALVSTITVGDRVCGSLTLVTSSCERRLGSAEQAAAEELARQIGAALTRME